MLVVVVYGVFLYLVPLVFLMDDGFSKVSVAPQLSVVILAYRSGSAIVQYVSKLESLLRQKSVVDYEIILVANYDHEGCDDITPKVARDLSGTNPRIKALTDPKEGMMGWDARMGLMAAQGETIALIDGDGQMPPEDIIRVRNVMVSGEFDFAKTYRVSREDGVLRKNSSRGFNFIYRLMFPGCRFRDINSKPKFFSRHALDRMNLTCNGWFFDGEVIIEVMRLNLSFAEIPTTFRANEWRGSFVKISTVLEMLISMVKFRVNMWK
jgi:glycosyltransferase involved in cell wall biosynthesis